MQNINEVSKKEYEEVLRWLFGNEIKIENELDETLCHDYYDPNIYYTAEIKELFETSAMQRLSKIMHLGSTNIEKHNAYHNRLEHSKGAYRRCLEFIAFQYRKPEWRKYIEENGQKGYLVEKLKFMCVHDIGHSLLSHSIENVIGDKDCDHEVIGNEIVKQNQDVQKILKKIKPNEENSKLGDGSLELFCEGNIDFDREDYIVRDCVYLGREYINDLVVTLNSMCNLKEVEIDGKIEMKYVYPNTVIPTIEKFLETRVELYKQEYRSKNRRMSDTITSYMVKYISNNELETGKKLREYISKFVNKSKEEIDVNEYIKGNDMLWLNSLIDIAENDSDSNLRDIAALCLPNTNGLINIVYPMVKNQQKFDANIESNDFNEEEKLLINNLKRIVRCDSTISEKIKTNKFKNENHIAVTIKNEETFEKVRESINNILEPDSLEGLCCEKIEHKKYNSKEPIYVESNDGKIYTFDKLPERTMDILPDYVYYIYMIDSILRLEDISQDKIDGIKNILEKYIVEEKEHVFPERMNRLRLRVGKELVVPKGILEYNERIKNREIEESKEEK